jgi:dipeptidyl aminopeptidase/acylaminoacyl peptidase
LKQNATLDEIMYSLKRYMNIRSVSSPKFSPDDQCIAFLSNITGVPQVWMTDSREEDARSFQLLSLDEERAGFLDYSRSRDLIVYGVDNGGNERYQICAIENKGDSFRKLTDRPNVIHNWGTFSPDQKQIAFSSNLRDQRFFDIYVQEIDSDSNSGELVYQNDATSIPVEWSPDGTRILFKTFHSNFNHELFLLDTSSHKAEPLLPHVGDAVFAFLTFDKSCEAIYCISDLGREFTALSKIEISTKKIEYLHSQEGIETELFAKSPDGSKLAFVLNLGGYSELLLWDTAKKKEPQKIDLPLGVLLDLAWSANSKNLAFTLTSGALNTDIWTLDIEHFALKRITRVSASGLTEKSFIEPRQFKYKSFDELEITSYIFLPRSSERESFPLLVYLHGGPEAQFRPTFSPLIQFFLKLGIAIGVPNFRGSTGLGRTFTHLDDVLNRMNTVKDVESFIARLKEDSGISKKIDFSRIAAWGGSYGGFMVLGCLYSNPELWAAGVDIVGIANFVTFLRNTGPWRRKLRIAEYGDPDKDGEFLSKISPVNNADKIRAPLFVIHGTNDPRVPLEEAEQIAETMTRLGREVHVLKFEGEGHGLHKIKDRIEGYSKATEFLLRHLKM